jgi:hypothetical protein
MRMKVVGREDGWNEKDGPVAAMTLPAKMGACELEELSPPTFAAVGEPLRVQAPSLSAVSTKQVNLKCMRKTRMTSCLM